MGEDKDQKAIEVATDQAIKEVIAGAAKNPLIRRAGDNLAGALVVLTETVQTFLLPLAAMNYAGRKAKDYFESKFQSDMEKAAEAIPVAAIVEPKASIAGPALQGLAFSHEEDELRELYLNLLASSMNADKATYVHPAFVEVIKQLTAREAELVGALLAIAQPFAPIVSVYGTIEGQAGEMPLMSHILPARDRAAGVPIFVANIDEIVDNWIRLGLFKLAIRLGRRSTWNCFVGCFSS